MSPLVGSSSSAWIPPREKGIGRRLIEAILGHFRAKGAQVARTMVAAQDKEIAGFIAAMGFVPAPLTALEKRL